MAVRKSEMFLRDAALAAGLAQFATLDRPCGKCGGVLRKCSNGTCAACNAAKGHTYRVENKEALAAKKKVYDAKNKDTIAKYQAQYQAQYRDEIITKPCPKCNAPLTASRSTHNALASPASGQKYCEHCRPEHLESLQPDAPCFMYVAELDGRHGQITGFGIAADPDRRWVQHRKNLHEEGMHVVGDVWISQQMTRAEALDIESMLKAFSDPCPIPGFKTESLRGHHAAGLVSFIQP